MLKSTGSHMDEEDEPDGYDSSSFKGGTAATAAGDVSEKPLNPHRSKHSETEQRRRSKINERFQILRDLIPQNDQKRDKASFLLEVIEYIQFLQEKLQMYEGSCQGWTQEPPKLMPWKNHRAAAESLVDHSLIVKSGSAVESIPLIPNVHNSIESDMGSAAAAMYKAIDHPSGSTTPGASFNTQTQPSMFSADGRGGMQTQSLQESLIDADNMAYHLHSQTWQSHLCATDDNASNGQEELMGEGGSVGFSSAYSQGVSNTLTQALQSSGVDLSHTSISVQIDVGKRAAGGTTMNQGNQYPSNQEMGQTTGGSCEEDSDQGHKRQRTKKS